MLSPRLWLSLFYINFFLGWGIYLPFWALWLKDQALPPTQIGLLLGLAQGTRALGSLLLTTRVKQAQQLIPASRLLSLATFCAFLAFLLPQSMALLVVLTVVSSLLYSPLVPLSDTLATRMVTQVGLDYGKVRLWGSVAFVLATTGIGYVTGWLGAEAILWCLLASQALMWLGTMIPMTVQPNDGEQARPALAWHGLLRQPMVLRFLAVVALIQGSHAAFYGFSAIHWQSLGIGEGAIGALWSLGVVVEVAIFYFARHLFAGRSAAQLLALAAGAVLLRWTGTAHAESLWALAGLQALHGLTFATAHLGAMQYIGRELPGHFAVGTQALYSAFCLSLAVAAMMLVSGALFEQVGGQIFLIMAALGLPALLLCRGLKRVED
ncbi:3-phenylpropionate MFS transporter [Gallaecimonas sp. GXIMD4217]|uniref:3-phenylpropionate MFS transporter n=1 Tax=Gallaecimonas sp. GXIMD4217 TaxID=3131927 RepID=UPI00311ADE8B